VGPFKLPVRVDEMNSFYNSGRQNASNTLAAALWSADVSFQFAAAGASGVNFHGGGTAPYSAIQSRFNRSTGEVSITTQANFYGYVLFQNAVEKANGLLSFIQTPGGKTKVWVVGTKVGLVRVAVLNLSETMASNITVQLPPGVTGRAGTLVRLVGPSAAAKNMVTFAGQTFDSLSGLPDGPFVATAVSVFGARNYSLEVPSASGAVLTIPYNI
jgi:hypothetical protein